MNRADSLPNFDINQDSILLVGSELKIMLLFRVLLFLLWINKDFVDQDPSKCSQFLWKIPQRNSGGSS